MRTIKGRVIQRALCLACICLVALVCWLALVGALAQAEIIHDYEGSFNGGKAPGGPFAYLLSDAADRSSDLSNGDVYVSYLDSSLEGFIDKVKGDGEYAGVQIDGAETPHGALGLISSSTFRVGSIAVDDSAGPNVGDLYVAEAGAGVVDKFSETGAFLCEITAKSPALRTTAEAEHECDGATGSETPQGSIEPTGVAVGSNGELYIADAEEGHDVIDEFSPSGAYVGQISDPRVGEPASIAVDSAGDVYVVSDLNFVVEFAPDGGLIGVINENQAHGVGIEPIAARLYVSVQSPSARILEYDSVGHLLASFGEGHVEEPAGLTVGPGGRVYVVSLFKESVAMFGPALLVPDVAVNVTEDQGTTATLRGGVDPLGGPEVTECRFEYGTTTSYGRSMPCEPATPYKTATSVATHLGGLTTGATYHFRLVACNANGCDEGEDHFFGPATVKNESAEAVVTTATLRGVVNPAGVETTCEVQYVDQPTYESMGYSGAASVPCATEVGGEAGEHAVEVPIGGLHIDTSYHYRFVAISGAGTVYGTDQTFATFGIKSFSFSALAPANEPLRQAGGHPYELVDSFSLNTSTDRFGKFNATDANPKDIVTELPPGLIGNPNATAKCTAHDIKFSNCSGAAQIGVLRIHTSELPGSVPRETESPLYDLVPQKGLAAQFGARFNTFADVFIDAKVRTGGDYGVTAEVVNASADEGVVAAEAVLWGVPGEESHDAHRYCRGGASNCSERGPLKPFLTLPSACIGSLTANMRVDPWQEPDAFVGASSKMPAISGCDRLDFKPSMGITPTSRVSDSPSGVDVELTVPQNENPNGVAEADLKDAKVTLPEGVTVSPSSANGLAGCSLLSGDEGHPGQSGIDLENAEPADCPNASKIGKVTIETPLLEKPLEGGVYVAQQNANPFKSLLALYIAAENEERGVVVKLAGHVELNPTTGQLTTTFDENPQLPFETLKLDFFGGERAPLATPRTCGSYRPTALLEPWSHQPAEGEAEGTPNAEPYIHPFEVTSGPGGSACDGSPFTPAFEAGAVNNQASAFGSFAMNLTRKDGEQRFSTVSMTLPPGLAGMISKVTQCGNAQAEAGDCSASSKIGHVTALAGVGNQPVVIPEAGKPEDPVYLTEKYDGAPFGLSIVVPAEAGPFNLGTVVVRAKINVNPHTGQVSIESQPMPTILQGIPLDVKAIRVEVNKPEFTFNPTNCKELHVDGTIGSAEGARASVSSRFQAANCASLSFKPAFKAETHAFHSRKKGSYLKVTIRSKQGQANLAKVRVTLPKKLPALLSTLHQACGEEQFAKDPAGCPKAATVGSVVVHTPVLAKPLIGPAIYVSHGSAKFPDLAFVLQGEGVTIIQEGATEIRKGLTTSSFEAIPDLPVNRIEVTLPEGEKPALGGHAGNLCTQTVTKRVKTKVHGKTVYRKRRVKEKATLSMPTIITGQNGAVVEQKTKVKVTGCGRASAHKKGKTKKKGSSKRKV